MIIIESISKSYGTQQLFRDAGFRLNPRERLGLVGRNGHGKTTLFRLITGEEEADSGNITIPKGYVIGHVDQEVRFSEETVLKEGCLGLPPREKGDHWKVEKILHGLGFSDEDFSKRPSQLSGGFQIRLNLAKVLVRDVNLLLLDEPNNYLDITSIRWLTRFLNNWKGELILITHDRSFMDNVVTHTVGIYRKTFRKIKGNTGKLYSQLAMEEEVYEKTRLNDEKKRKKSEEFIRRFRAKARLGGLVQSRIKTLEKQERLEKLEKAKDLDFSFTSRPFNGKPVMNVNSLSFGYETDRPVFSDLSFSIGPYDRICVVGKNGKGKTTLLKTLSGGLDPDSGEIKLNPTVSTGYYEQTNIDLLDDEKSVLDEVVMSNPDVDHQKARNICGMMMFEGDSALKKIRVLSGGEKSRVMMGKVIATPVNFLLLDEPTNHLDMESCDALLEAINEFEGAVVMVTHNEMLLHGLAERLIIFQQGNARIFEGSYQRFLERVGWEEEDGVEAESEEDKKREKKINRKLQKRLRAEMISERSKVLKPIERKLKDLEKEIVDSETLLERLHDKIISASEEGRHEDIADLSKNIDICRKKIDDVFIELERTSTEYEKEKASFEERMGSLD